MNKFEFAVNNVKKDVKVKLNGVFENEDRVAFLAEYEKLTKSIKSSDYTLEIDCRGLARVFTQELAEGLVPVVKSYIDDGYRTSVIIQADSSTGSCMEMQFNRLFRKASLVGKIQIIKSV